LRSDPKRECNNGTEAWIGHKPAAGEIRLYKSTWENPRPSQEIATIDFVSGKIRGAPFLFALTADP
jgi:hypothetical protein